MQFVAFFLGHFSLTGIKLDGVDETSYASLCCAKTIHQKVV